MFRRDAFFRNECRLFSVIQLISIEMTLHGGVDTHFWRRRHVETSVFNIRLEKVFNY